MKVFVVHEYSTADTTIYELSVSADAPMSCQRRKSLDAQHLADLLPELEAKAKAADQDFDVINIR